MCQTNQDNQNLSKWYFLPCVFLCGVVNLQPTNFNHERFVCPIYKVHPDKKLLLTTPITWFLIGCTLVSNLYFHNKELTLLLNVVAFPLYTNPAPNTTVQHCLTNCFAVKCRSKIVDLFSTSPIGIVSPSALTFCSGCKSSTWLHIRHRHQLLHGGPRLHVGGWRQGQNVLLRGERVQWGLALCQPQFQQPYPCNLPFPALLS